MSIRVLFVCTKNAVRSPMSKAIAEQLQLQGDIGGIHIDSAGIDPADVDGFAIATMAELGIDIQHHEAKDLGDFAADDFDVLITLSKAAAAYAQENYAEVAAKIEIWDVGDPSLIEGNRDQRLEAYRAVARALQQQIGARFGG